MVCGEGFFEKKEIDYWNKKDAEEPKEEIPEEKKAPLPKTVIISDANVEEKKSENKSVNKPEKTDEDKKFLAFYEQFKDSPWAERTVDADGKVVVRLPPEPLVRGLEAQTDDEMADFAYEYLQYNIKRFDKLKKFMTSVKMVQLEEGYISPDDFYIPDKPESNKSMVSYVDQALGAKTGPYEVGIEKPNLAKEKNGEDNKPLESKIKIPGVIDNNIQVLWFFDSECSHCRAHLSTIIKFYNAHKDALSFKAIFTNMDQHKLGAFRSYQNTRGEPIEFPLYWTIDVVRKIVYHEEFEIKGTPTTIFMNIEKRKIAIFNGSEGGIEALESELKKIL